MKKIASLLILLAAALTLFDACKPEQDLTPKKGNAIFSLSQKARNTSGRTEETPVPAAVLLSIKDVSGTFLHENKKLALYGLGQGYVSESLELPAGKYSLTQFAILDAAGKIIYATPLEGSDLAHYVNDPLPVEFTITENESTKVVPQVLPVLEEDKPESFGYASFGFEIASPKNQVSQIIFNESYGYINTITFHYQKNRVSKVDWDLLLSYPSQNFSKYTEVRNFDEKGQLISIEGGNVWNLLYSYNNGKLSQIITKKDIGWTGSLKYYSTETFLDYQKDNPTKIKVESYIPDYILKSSMEYNSAGNLINIKITDENDIPDKNIVIEYTNEVNPLQSLLETPITALYGYHQHDVFYYSKNLPKTITRIRYFDYDGYEKYVFSYSYVKDTLNRVTDINVTVNAVMGVTNKYETQVQNGIAYTIKINY